MITVRSLQRLAMEGKPEEHHGRQCKDANLLQKALRLAMEPLLSNPFILCSDDHILLRPSLPAEFRLWHRGEIAENLEEDAGPWDRRLVNTGRILRNQGYSAKNFDGHVPYPLRKEWIREVLRFDFGAKPGMCVFSTILNCSHGPAFPLSSERIRGWLGRDDMAADVVDAKLAKNQFACLNESSMDNGHIVSRLEQLFPEPAPWEIDAARWVRRNSIGVAPSSAAWMFGS